MSDEMKLIMALCDALGFDVEVNNFEYRDKTNFNVHMIGRDYKLIKRNKPQRDGSIVPGSLMQEIQSIAIKNAKKDLGLD